MATRKGAIERLSDKFCVGHREVLHLFLTTGSCGYVLERGVVSSIPCASFIFFRLVIWTNIIKGGGGGGGGAVGRKYELHYLWCVTICGV